MSKEMLTEDAAGNRRVLIGEIDHETLAIRGLKEVKDDTTVKRPRRKRTKADMQRLIKEGIVRDPNAPPEPEPEYGPDTHVIRVPSAKAGAKSDQ